MYYKLPATPFFCLESPRLVNQQRHLVILAICYGDFIDAVFFVNLVSNLLAQAILITPVVPFKQYSQVNLLKLAKSVAFMRAK